MAKAKEYRVVYEPDDGQWSAEVLGKPGGALCITWGRSLREARSRVRDALATALEDDAAAEAAVLVEEFKVPEQTALNELRSRRLVVEQSAKTLADDTRRVVRSLLASGRKYSVRDVAELVGTSHQRVQQLAEVPPAARKAIAAKKTTKTPAGARSGRSR